MSVIAVFAGHGGSDPGAVSGSLLEKDFTLAVANRTASFLTEIGHTVIRNRTTDRNSTIEEKVALANNGGVQAVVEIHLNSNLGTPGTGTEIYYGTHDNKSFMLAKSVLERVVALGFRDRGLKTRLITSGVDAGKDYFGIIRRCHAPAILIETAFINNPADMARYDIGKMAGAIAAGILEHFPAPVQERLYRVQAGAFTSQENARAHVQRLREAGFEAIIKHE